MSFSIKLLDKKIERESDIFQVGEIIINDYSETFQSSLSYWNKSDYIHQWKEGIRYTLEGNKKSCLITSMFDPEIANYIFLWLLYLEKNTIHIQNQVLFLENSNKYFNTNRLYDYISEREIVDEESNYISEWDIKFNDLEKFFVNNL